MSGTTPAPGLDPALAASVRRDDPDRFAIAMLCPPDRRAAVVAVLAFAQEIAKTRAVVSEAVLGQIRLTWWAEAIAELYDGRPRSHPIIQALAPAIAASSLARQTFEQLIAARSADLDADPPATLAELEAYAAATGGSVASLILQCVCRPEPAAEAAARAAGTAHALSGLMSGAAAWARAGKLWLPADQVSGAARSAAQDLKDTDASRAAVTRVLQQAEALCDVARDGSRHVDKAGFPALLPAVLSRRYAKAVRRAGQNVLSRAPAARDPWTSARLAWALWRRRV